MENKIAVVGLACQLPGAKNVQEYWNNLLLEKDTIKHFTDEELEKIEFDYESLRNNPAYVKAHGVLSDIDKFDAPFFNMTPKEAAETDPQHRLWLQTAWNALEDAGCDPFSYKGAIGVFAGGYGSSYLHNNILRDRIRFEYYLRSRSSDSFQIMTGNETAFISTKTAYKFNLRGPAVNVQTACSTSLVAIIQACQSLYSYESDMCLAGGVCILVPQETGYIYQEGAIGSPDGHCRPFDEKAKGTVPSNGVGVVVLKRLEDALNDGDRIYATVNGWALNNDGSNKVSYTAPSVDGQAEAIMMAQSFAEISPDEITYIEAHGTATPLGDPIEIAALTKAFRAKTSKKQFCAIGSVKSNIGHTDAAAGAAAFIKTCLAAYYRKIPATLHFTKPNPHIDFENSPFYVLNQLKEYKESKPLIMGVSSFGIGGTNAHLIVEEPPKQQNNPYQSHEWPTLLMVSAKSVNSLEQRKQELIDYFNANPGVNINDVSYTLAVGRNHMAHRSFISASNLQEIINGARSFTDGKKDNQISKVAFMFPGQGAQYVSMGKELYHSSSLFREILDNCFEIFRAETGENIKDIIFQDRENKEALQRLSDTEITQPALFIIEYATARVMMDLGVQPSCLIGHSIGEYVAACISGVFDLKTALKIVIKRGKLMQKMPRGEMMVAKASKIRLEEMKGDFFEIAAENAGEFCTISLKPHNLGNVKNLLDKNEIGYIPLNTSHAFHSSDFDPILQEFADYVKQFALNVPTIPFISCLTGDFITNIQATSGDYWSQQLRNTVLFRKGISSIVNNENVAFLEVGPNTHLSPLVKQNESVTNKKSVVATLGKADSTDEKIKIINAVGSLFTLGIPADIEVLQKNYVPKKIGLPTYPFEKTRHWIDFDITKVNYNQSGVQIQSEDNLLVPQEDTKSTSSTDKVEREIKNIWQSLFGIENIGLDDDFYDLGGHSLLALQINNRIKDTFKIEISLKDFIENATVSKNCSLVRERAGIAATPEITATPEGISRTTNLPISNDQFRLWLITVVDQNNPAYNVPYTLKLTGKIDHLKLKQAVEFVIDRHQVFKTKIQLVNGEPKAFLEENLKDEIQLLDWTGNGIINEVKIQEFLTKEVRKSFILSEAPLFRGYLIKLEPQTFILHITAHHVVVDGWSWGVFNYELHQAYNALIQGNPLSLPALKTQYYDYTAELAKIDVKTKYASSLTYWKKQLSDVPKIINFPWDKPRPEMTSGIGGHERVVVPANLSEKLRQLSKRNNVSLFTTVYATFVLLLHKYSSDEDICIGAPVANRNNSNYEKLMGLFVNTVILRAKVNGTLKFNDFLHHCGDTLLNALSHQDLPFEKLVNELDIERTLNINPIFQVMLTWLSSPANPFSSEDVKAENIQIRESISPLDLTFYAWESDGKIEGDLEFSHDVLSRETIAQFKENYLTLLSNVAENPDIFISDISIVSDSAAKLLNEYNATEVALPDLLLHELFSLAAGNNENKVAVRNRNTQLSYHELDLLSNQLASYLIANGLSKGEAVGLSVHRDPLMVAALLGILKAGGCYLPLDPSFPDDRLNYMLEDSAARFLITQNDIVTKYNVSHLHVLLIDSLDEIKKYPTTQPKSISKDQDSLAYTIYTSGSTGKPKGVKIHHRAVVNFIRSMSKTPGINSEDVLLAVTTLSFDISVLEVFLPLSYGASVVIATSEDTVNGVALMDLIERFNVTQLQATPATWNMLLNAGWKGKTNLKALCGGEAMSPNLAESLIPRVESLWNMYGPTETTVWSTCMKVENNSTPILVGKPIDNTTIYITDKYNRKLPVGVYGEVIIGGKGVTKGYHNRPELTSEKFIMLDNELVYKTGDNGRIRLDGKLEIAGRVDNQIKLRGFRIEPGEIESTLCLVNGIKEAVVKVHKIDDFDERLVAFLRTEDGVSIPEEEIRAQIGVHLPAYMVPSNYQFLEKFPRTPNGKIDRKALIVNLDEIKSQKQVDLRNFTKIQKGIHSIWQKTLKTNSIGLNDNFFNIGGNSLLVISCLNSINSEFGSNLSFRDFFANPTIEKLSFILENQKNATDSAIKLIHSNEMTNLPLTGNQRRLWLIANMDPDIASYIIPFTFKLKGKIDQNIFQKSIERLFNRHHNVFSRFKEINGEPFCDIVPSEVKISFPDYSGLPEAEKVKKLHELIDADSKKVFDLTNGPLYRLYLISTGNEEYYFHFSIHHIVFDGWSWAVFANDFSKIYNSLRTANEPELGEIAFQEYDYALWEQSAECIESEKKAVEFWRENLKDSSPILTFPYDFPRSENPSGIGRYENLNIAAPTTKKLRDISSTSGTSLFTTLFGIFGIQMQKYSGQDDLNIGMPVAYRPHSKLEDIFGMFVNTVVVRFKFSKGQTLREIIKQTNEAAMNAITYQNLAFDKVVDLVNPERSTNVNPLFQVAFAWQSNLNASLFLDGVTAQEIDRLERAVEFDVTLNLWENENSIDGAIEYNTDILTRETILRLKDNFIHMVETFADHADTAIESIPAITSADLNLIESFNQTRTDYPRESTIAQLFEEQAALYPDKQAVVYKDKYLTYSQLNQQANKIARNLRRKGVGANSLVGIMADKSIEMIAGIFGILKAGGAYVPMDPDYPEQRMNFIAQDSGLRLLLTQQKFSKLRIEGIDKIYFEDETTYDSDGSNVEGINTPDDLAYIIYTSGTTGTPKGSLIPQRGVVRLVRNTNYVEYTPADKVSQASAIVFDASTEEIFGALLNGCPLYVIDKETLLDPNAFGDLLLKNEITIVDLTSALFTQIAEARTDIFAKVKYLILGGDVVSAPHVAKVRKANPGITVVNTYGPTENSCNSTGYKIDKDFDYNIPIGKPISNSTAYIFDKHMNYQPIGVIGELYVGGDGLSKGYLNRDDLNRTAFLYNPYNPAERLYKTGDLARWLPDGNIEFHGRIDNQIKIRGYRVELEEIESVISDIEGVIETVIKPIKMEEGDYKLVAFLNVPENSIVQPAEIERVIKAKLPPYMVPSAYKFMHGFPKNVNGKIDRKALNFDINELTSGDRKENGDLTPTEQKLLEIWSEILKTKDILTSDNFFDIGGNSLIILRCINKIKEVFGVNISFKEFIAEPYINQLSKFIDSRIQSTEEAIKLVHLDRTSDLPLTNNQKRLLMISKFDPDVASYIVSDSFRFTGNLNFEVFRKSLEILFNRHHIIFSVFKEIDGEPYCDIVPSDIHINLMDYTHLEEKEKLESVKKILETDSKLTFNLNKGPLFRLYLITTGKEEYYFHISIHHIVFDGWSWSVFAEDFNKIYNSLVRGEELNLDPLDIQEYDYAEWEKSYTGSETEKKSIQFWTENLKGSSPVLNFPYDFPRKETPSGRGSYEHIILPAGLSDKIRQISKTEGASLFTALLTLSGIQMRKYAGADDINIGMPVAYRPHSKLEDIFGMFVNTIVVRLKYEKEQTFRELFRHNNDSALNALAHQDLAFDKVVEIVKPERSSNVNPLFQVAYVWQNNLDTPINLEGIRCERIENKEMATDFDITFNFWENGDHIEGTIEYNLDVLKQETIIRLKDNFIKMAETVLDHTDSAIDSLPLITPADLNLIESFNQTRTDYPRESTIAQLFEEQATLYPNKQAVVYKDKHLTYSQLNQQANKIARTLRKKGVGANSLVGIMADKSIEMIAGIFGILKAGGAYVPMDPEYPEQRMNFIVQDSGLKLLLTQQKFSNLPIEGIDKIYFDDQTTYDSDGSNVERINTPDDLAYIIYTSGTTGTPKGSLIPQRGVVRLVRNTNYVEYTPADKVSQASAIVFDASTEEIFGALLNGCPLYVIDKETLLDPNAFGDILLKNEITIVDLTSALFTQIAEARTDIFAKVKYLILGGDVVSAPHVAKVRKANPGITVVNTYGPTENSCNSTGYKIDRDFDYNIPIGKPISNSTAYIFDKNMNYQPIGVTGELYVGGDGLSKGYLNRDDLNRTAFVYNPYNPSERLYKTGDLARWLPDGNIEFHGRIDNQIKIRGYRVELEEIESVISDIEGVIETVIKPIKMEEGDYKLVAFLNVPENSLVQPAEIERVIKAKLPPYMVPSAYKFMHGFPKNVNGKIDRKALNFDINELTSGDRKENGDLTPTEQKLLEIWSEILKTKDILTSDNFFDIGGNSLMTINLSSKIQKTFGIEFNLRDFFGAPRIKDLAIQIELMLNSFNGKTEVSNTKINIIEGEI